MTTSLGFPNSAFEVIVVKEEPHSPESTVEDNFKNADEEQLPANDLSNNDLYSRKRKDCDFAPLLVPLKYRGRKGKVIENIGNKLMPTGHFLQNTHKRKPSVPCVCGDCCDKTKKTKKTERYLPEFKQRVLAFALTHTFKETAKNFNIHHSTVSEWCRDQTTKETIKRQTPNPVSDSDSISPEMQIIKWLQLQRLNDHIIVTEELIVKLKEIEKQHGEQHLKESSKWFWPWYQRFSEPEDYVDDEKLKDRIGQKEERLIYFPLFKLECVYFADKQSIRKAAKLFHIDSSTISCWSRGRSKLEALAERGKLCDRGPKQWEKYSEADESIWNWFSEMQSLGCKPKKTEIKRKATQIFNKLQIKDGKSTERWYNQWSKKYNVKARYAYDDEIIEWILVQFDRNHSVKHQELQQQSLKIVPKYNPAFKASAGWSIRFCKRYPLLLKASTDIGTLLPPHMQAKVVKYRKDIQTVQANHGFTLAAIGCMDEVPVSFSKDVTSHKKREFLLKPTEMENSRVKVILSCLADGAVLPPLIILSEQNYDYQKHTQLPGQLVLVRKEAAIDVSVIQHWLENVWFRYVPSPNLLLLDSFDPHCSDQIIDFMDKNHTKAMIIPGGCSLKLQPLEIDIKKNFLSLVHQEWMKVNIDDNDLDYNRIILMIFNAFEELKKKDESIRNSFVVTGITTAADHSQDHLIENPGLLNSSTANSFNKIV